MVASIAYQTSWGYLLPKSFFAHNYMVSTCGTNEYIDPADVWK